MHLRMVDQSGKEVHFDPSAVTCFWEHGTGTEVHLQGGDKIRTPMSLEQFEHLLHERHSEDQP